MNQQKFKTKIEMMTTKSYRVTSCKVCQIGYRSSSMSVPEHRDASSSSRELPLEPRAKVVPGEHRIFTHFPKDLNCDICFRTKITRASCRRRTGTVVPRAAFLDHKVPSHGCDFDDLITADHMVI